MNVPLPLSRKSRQNLKSRQAAALTVGLPAFSALAAHADEGMGLYNGPPKAQIQKACGVTLSDAWPAHLQRAPVKFVGLASGSFVCANGLVMTNRHIGADTLQKLSRPQHNYAGDGFYARTHVYGDDALAVELLSGHAHWAPAFREA